MVEYRSLGNTGLKVSPIGLGLMRLPLAEGKQGYTSSRGADVDKSVELMRYAIDHGINYLDTAFNYLHGESEKIVGRALQDGYRDKVILASKSPIWMIDSPDKFDSLLEKQLGRMKTDHLDVYLLHCVTKKDWENHVLPNKVVEHLLKAKEDGRVRYIGFSFHDTYDVFREVADYASWDICQLQLNYLDREFQGGLQAAEYAANKGMGVIAMEPLRGGHLVNVPDKVRQVFQQAHPNRPPVEWAFDFLWNRPEVSLLLSGMGTCEQIEQNIGFAQKAHVGMLSAADNAAYDAAEAAFKSYPTIPCTGCNYCSVCPEGVTIPYNFQTYNQYILSGNLARAKWEYATSIPLNGATAAACIGCGTCEERCPQKIPISEWMPKIDALFA
jgi:predicted aldo/keto reductase-like oxidoreductase